MLIPFLALLLTPHQQPASCCGGDMTPFTADPAFMAMHRAPKEYAFTPREGAMTTFKDADGKPTNAFYVAPTAGTKVAIVMVHEFWGLNDQIKAEAEKIHDSTGYAVLAVDMYEGKATTDPSEARELMSGVDKTRCVAIVAGAIKDLKQGDLGVKFSKIGTIGYCFGGGWSHEAAIQGGKNVQACVMYYGMPDTKPDALAKLKAPVLMIHGAKDAYINQKVVDGFRSAMSQAGKSLQVLDYQAGHGFANPNNPGYDKSAADDAYSHVLAFFKQHLG